MIINLNGKIDNELFQILVDGINQSIEKNEQIVIYFCSEGGSLDYTEAILDLIEIFADRILLIGYGFLYSSGFMIYHFSKCQKKLLNPTVGMIHLPYYSNILNIKGEQKDDSSKFDFECGKVMVEKFMKDLKNIGLTKQEIKKIEDGKDLYFSYKRMLELDGKK